MSDRVCDIAGCGRAHVARGWCSRHYEAWRFRTDLNGTRKEHRRSKDEWKRRQLLADIASQPDVTVVRTETELLAALKEPRVFVAVGA